MSQAAQETRIWYSYPRCFILQKGQSHGFSKLFYGAGGLALLTGLVYWAGYKAEGMSKAGRENRKLISFSYIHPLHK